MACTKYFLMKTRQYRLYVCSLPQFLPSFFCQTLLRFLKSLQVNKIENNIDKYVWKEEQSVNLASSYLAL